MDAWNSSEANRASIQDDSFFSAISVKNGADGNNDEINITEGAGSFSVSVTGNTLSINLEKNIEDYEPDEIAAIISTINSDPANTLFQITSTTLFADTFTASGGGEWGGTGGLIGKITDQNGGSSFDVLINNLAKGGDFTTYSAEAPTHTHKMENLNQWLGRDREEVTYEETEDADGNPLVLIKLGKDENGNQITEIDPYKVADAYYAFINKKYLAGDEAEKKVDMSKFMAPVVVDSSGNISTTTKLEQMVLGKNGTEVVTRDDQRSGFVFNPATEKIEKSNEITVRVKTGDRTDHEHDQEDSFQLYVKYSPPEKEEETAVGTGSDFQIPILALGLGLLRDDQKAEFDVGDLHMEAESAGEYTLRIETQQGITFSRIRQ